MADRENILSDYLSKIGIDQSIIPRVDLMANAAKNLEYVSRPPIVPYDGNLASEFHKRLFSWIAEYDQGLDNEHEVGLRLVSFGQTVTIHLQHIGDWNPSLMRFAGTCDDGTPVNLIQHVSQISILLMTLPRLDPSQPKRPIGFDAAPRNPENLPEK